MAFSGDHPPPGMLREFPIFSDLNDDQLALLAKHLAVKSAAKGSRLIALGSSDSSSYLLLSGEVELRAGDGGRKRIESGSESARSPLAQLLPRRYDVVVTKAITYLVVDSTLLEHLRDASAVDQEPTTLLVDLAPESDYAAVEQGLLAERLRTDLEGDRLVIPSLPEVALRVGRALNDEVTDAHTIASIIQADPAITAKIVRAANSALYAGRSPVNSCSAAVVRLGVNTTHKLVLSFALREISRARSPNIKQRMAALWSHSTRVAAICHVLARLIRLFNPEHAMLSGLVHDIGTVAILSYADGFSELAADPSQIDRAIEALRGPIGAEVLRKWHFPEDFMITALESEHWTRDPAPEPDYCDLVIAAQLHSFVGTPQARDLPHIGQTACFRKLNLGELTPRQSLKILDQANEQLIQAEQLLAL